MKNNYEQIRAKNALKAAPTIMTGKEGGQTVAKKVAAMIIENGFIGAMAFAIEAGDSVGNYHVFQAILTHLKSVKMDFGMDCSRVETFLDQLCGKNAGVLRAVTTESMAYMCYLRRFAKSDKNDTP